MINAKQTSLQIKAHKLLKELTTVVKQLSASSVTAKPKNKAATATQKKATPKKPTAKKAVKKTATKRKTTRTRKAA